MVEPVVLTEREWDVWAGIKAHKTPTQIAEGMGVTPQRVTTIRAVLRDKGLVRQVGELPAHGRYTEDYPWELTSEQPPAYKPALPPRARLRLSYPQNSARDVMVPPIRHVRWGDWSVQGIPVLRPDGKPPYEALPEQRLVLITHVLGSTQWVFSANARRPWSESDTTIKWIHRWIHLVTDEARRAMTLVIAAAIGVDAVFDLTTVKEPNQ